MGQEEILNSFGEHVDLVIPNSFSPRVGNLSKFALTVSDCADWNEHEMHLRKILCQIEHLLKTDRFNAINVQFDIACEPDDYLDRFIFGIVFSSETLSSLTHSNVELAFSVYGSGNGSQNKR